MNILTGLIGLLTLLAALFSTPSQATDINNERAKYNYQLLCQGCHTPDGSGSKSIPQIKNHIGRFLATSSGREYLIRVPGAANSTLDDSQLAEVLNWMILEFGGLSTPANMELYTADEVKVLRQSALFEVTEYRNFLLSQLP
ncbi:cytochrome c, class I [Shewanella sp. YLB-07]|uniref:cytochrome c, class I n=1 Tax=Shewanella sp. YLB-07 TaxID=2601268 RepID=UPI001D13ABF1|nr:cytochrome c, class I [Shewanella sp. YLB-07]